MAIPIVIFLIYTDLISVIKTISCNDSILCNNLFLIFSMIDNYKIKIFKNKF